MRVDRMRRPLIAAAVGLVLAAPALAAALALGGDGQRRLRVDGGTIALPGGPGAPPAVDLQHTLLARTSGRLWAVTRDGVAQIDPRSRQVTARVRLSGVVSIAPDDDVVSPAVWAVVDRDSRPEDTRGELVRIDARTLEVERWSRIEGGRIDDLASAGGKRVGFGR